MDIDKHNIYAKELINAEKEHKQKVEDLVTSVKNLEKLQWIRFSKDLEEIKRSYDNFVFDLILNYKSDFKQNSFLSGDIYSTKTLEFHNFCDNIFDEVYEHFEKINCLE